MSTSTPTAPTAAASTRRPEAGNVQAAADGARRAVTTTVETVRSTAGEVGNRMPGLVDGLRAGATEGARSIEAWPETTRRMVAAVSIGLGAGLAIAGAPRLFLGAALLPALAVAATEMRREQPRSARTS